MRNAPRSVVAKGAVRYTRLHLHDLPPLVTTLRMLCREQTSPPRAARVLRLYFGSGPFSPSASSGSATSAGTFGAGSGRMRSVTTGTGSVAATTGRSVVTVLICVSLLTATDSPIVGGGTSMRSTLGTRWMANVISKVIMPVNPATSLTGVNHLRLTPFPNDGGAGRRCPLAAARYAGSRRGSKSIRKLFGFIFNIRYFRTTCKVPSPACRW